MEEDIYSAYLCGWEIPPVRGNHWGGGNSRGASGRSGGAASSIVDKFVSDSLWPLIEVVGG